MVVGGQGKGRGETADCCYSTHTARLQQDFTPIKASQTHLTPLQGTQQPLYLSQALLQGCNEENWPANAELKLQEEFCSAYHTFLLADLKWQPGGKSVLYKGGG